MPCQLDLAQVVKGWGAVGISLMFKSYLKREGKKESGIAQSQNTDW